MSPTATKLLIDQHGEDANIRAAERADELLDDSDDGDTEGPSGAVLSRQSMSYSGEGGMESR